MNKMILEMRNKDLKVRLENLTAKKEITELQLQDEIDALSQKVREKDGQIKMLQDYIASIEQEIDSMKKELVEKDKKIEKLQKTDVALRNQIDKLKVSLNKNSINSSKPPSTDGFREAKASSTRRRSGKKPGGQPGHRGHTAKYFPNPTEIVEKKPPAICSCGGHINCGTNYTPKQTVDIKIELEIVEERRFDGQCEICGMFHHGDFSETFVNPVQYGSNVKAFIAILNCYGNVPVNKTVEILNGISGGVLNLSEGTVVNIQKNLAEKLNETIEIIKHRLIACNVLGADETGCRINGKLNWIQIFSNNQFTLFGLNEKRGSLYADGMDVLALFTGILVHDHFKAYYKHELMSHAECNAHILRYLQAVIEIMKHPWATEMAELLRELNKLKKDYLALGINSIDEDELNSIHARYDKILEEGNAQYEAAIKNKKSIPYYNDERLLLKRLTEYKEEHLRFLTNFEVPFDNNGSERDARFFKNKIKVSGGFRSAEAASNYIIIASLISTLRKHDANVYLTINDIFNGNTPKFESVYSSGAG